MKPCLRSLAAEQRALGFRRTFSKKRQKHRKPLLRFRRQVRRRLSFRHETLRLGHEGPHRRGVQAWGGEGRGSKTMDDDEDGGLGVMGELGSRLAEVKKRRRKAMRGGRRRGAASEVGGGGGATSARAMNMRRSLPSMQPPTRGRGSPCHEKNLDEVERDTPRGSRSPKGSSAAMVPSKSANRASNWRAARRT